MKRKHAPEVEAPVVVEAAPARAHARTLPRWPLFIIGLPAAVAVWSGWVGLGGMTGFGVIHPLPGIWDAATLNTAVTLPIGVEAYGAYALGAWLTPSTPEGARRFAKWSAIGALVLGMLGQVAYHVLAAEHITRAPWPVVALVACLPVATLGMGTALAHLMRNAHGAPEADTASVSVAVEAEAPSAPEADTPSVPVAEAPAVPEVEAPNAPVRIPRAPRPDTPSVAARHTPRTAEGHTPRTHYRADLGRGELPGVRAIMRDFHVGAPRARVILADLGARGRVEAEAA